jgi:cytochrome c peroxidase
VTQAESDRGKFATPSLRNVAVVGPYMHDGRFQTLDQVVEHYASGVVRTATLDPNLAKHPVAGLPLTAADKQALVAFLTSLTDPRLTPVVDGGAGRRLGVR